MQFSDFGLSSVILRAVEAAGYSVPPPLQSQTIPHLMQGRDLLGCAQTGTGKTAAFALPILHRLQDTGSAPQNSASRPPVRVLVLAPTRELASQICQSFSSYGKHTGLRTTEIYGGVSQVGQVRALRQGVEILVATPGRLVDLMGQGLVRLEHVEIFVMDEADRMLDMGFLPDLRKVIAALPKKRQNVLFSATMPASVESLACKILQDPVAIRIAATPSAEPRIRQSVCFATKQQKPALLAQWLRRETTMRAFVFTRTKHGADRVARQLERAGIPAEAIHGNKTQSARQRTLARFKMNHTSVLVATDLAARGLDVDSVSHVFNYDVPVDAETYVHRIGRTGRAGAEGIAVSFCDPDERKYLRSVERLLGRTLDVEALPEGIPAAERTTESFVPRDSTRSTRTDAPASNAGRPPRKKRRFQNAGNGPGGPGRRRYNRD
ncbi:MAG: DEAD/DEAH box helicase [Planctomycetota bacterium]|nr:DEAD/DEAH box helicase [Planctomycetota bacterium]